MRNWPAAGHPQGNGDEPALPRPAQDAAEAARVPGHRHERRDEDEAEGENDAALRGVGPPDRAWMDGELPEEDARGSPSTLRAATRAPRAGPCSRRRGMRCGRRWCAGPRAPTCPGWRTPCWRACSTIARRPRCCACGSGARRPGGRTGAHLRGRGLAVAASLAVVALLSPLRSDTRTGPLLADARGVRATVDESISRATKARVLQSGQTTVIWVDDDSSRWCDEGGVRCTRGARRRGLAGRGDSPQGSRVRITVRAIAATAGAEQTDPKLAPIARHLAEFARISAGATSSC